jgi:hypothetical protein
MKKVLALLFPKTPAWVKIASLPLLMLASIIYAPMLLAFPYHAQFGATDVYSVQPIHPRTAEILTRADQLLAKSPLYTGPVSRQIYLTDGGWRWSVLALNTRGAAALRRPINNAIIVNRADIANDLIDLNWPVGGKRTLSGLFAHETTHILQTDYFGFLKVAASPQWVVEGYADYVAQEGSLSDADVRLLETRREPNPALPYYYGRKRLAEVLAKNGGSVDALFGGK